MTEGNKHFLKAIGSLLVINLVLNMLPPPYSLIAFGGIIIYFLVELYKQTRY